MKNTDVLVVVLTRIHMTGLGVVRALGEAGYTVDTVASSVVAGRSEFLSQSRYLRNHVEIITRKLSNEGDEKLLEKLLEYEREPFDKIVLFPTDDYSASFMDRNREELEKIFLMPYITDGKIIDRMDKTYQSRIAGEAGLLTPEEWIISLKGEIVIPDDMIYPCFVKPLQSITGLKYEMKRCDSYDELKNHLDFLKERNPLREILCQEFLSIDKEYDLSGVCLDQKIIIPALIEKTHVAQYDRGVTMSGKIIKKDALKDIMPAVEKMLQTFRYTGMFDMEFNVCGGRIYFNEVNLRTGGPYFSYYLSGSNLPDVVVSELIGREHDISDEEVDVYGKNFIYEKVAWEEYLHDCMTRRELKKSIAAADFTLLGYDKDPEPGEFFNGQMKKKARQHVKSKIRGKIGSKNE